MGVFEGFGDRESSWLASSSVKGTRVKRLRKLKRTRGECGFWMLAKGARGLDLSSVKQCFYFHCAQGQKERRG